MAKDIDIREAIGDRAAAAFEKIVRGFMYDSAPKKMQFPQGLRYRYWGKFELRSGIWACCYSVTKNANGKYVSYVYQPVVGKKSWKMVKLMEHRTRRQASDRAARLYNAHEIIQNKAVAALKAMRKVRGNKR